jgi:hypothetical protein
VDFVDTAFDLVVAVEHVHLDVDAHVAPVGVAHHSRAHNAAIGAAVGFKDLAQEKCQPTHGADRADCSQPYEAGGPSTEAVSMPTIQIRTARTLLPRRRDHPGPVRARARPFQAQNGRVSPSGVVRSGLIAKPRFVLPSFRLGVVLRRKVGQARQGRRLNLGELRRDADGARLSRRHFPDRPGRPHDRPAAGTCVRRVWVNPAVANGNVPG